MSVGHWKQSPDPRLVMTTDMYILVFDSNDRNVKHSSHVRHDEWQGSIRWPATRSAGGEDWIGSYRVIHCPRGYPTLTRPSNLSYDILVNNA